MSRIGTAATRGWDTGEGGDTGYRVRPATRLLRRWQWLAPLPEEDVALVHADVADVRTLAPHQPCIRQGQLPTHAFLVTDGWMLQWQILPDGSRQVTGLLIPGDFCNDPATVEHGFDAGVSALGPAAVAPLMPDTIAAWHERPALARAIDWMRLSDEAVQRSWMVSIGRRDAYGRLAYLLCQLHARLGVIGEAQEHGFQLPATQEHLADALGLTPVHVNRVLKRLREDGLVEIRRARVHLPDPAGLRERAGFADRDIYLGTGSAAGRSDRRARREPVRYEAETTTRFLPSRFAS